MYMRSQVKQRGEDAATLLEVVMAIVIIAITGGALLAAVGYGFKALRLVRENQRATQIAMEKTETIRLYHWNQVNSNGFIPSTFPAVYDPGAPAGKQGITYSGSIKISPFPNVSSYASQMRLVTISVSWNSGGKTHTRSVETAVAKDGEQNYVW